MTLQLNVVSPKSLEKQLKLVEGRMQELQGELRELEKIRTACLILLGNAAEFPDEKEELPPETAAPKALKKKSERRANGNEAEAERDEFLATESGSPDASVETAQV